MARTARHGVPGRDAHRGNAAADDAAGAETDPYPIRTPGRTTALPPIHTLSAITIGSENRPKSGRAVRLTRG